MANNNRNSNGFHNRDVINERAEAAAERGYDGSGAVKSGKLVGDVMPDGGLTSMTPLAGKGAPTSARASVNTTPNRITPELRARLTTMTPETANRVRAVVARKP
jgi:hypothetical protein